MVSGVTTLRLVSDSDGSLIASKSISGSGTYSITADTPLEPGARYRVLVDADGATYTDALGNFDTASASSSDVDIVSGFRSRFGDFSDSLSKLRHRIVSIPVGNGIH